MTIFPFKHIKLRNTHIHVAHDYISSHLTSIHFSFHVPDYIYSRYFPAPIRVYIPHRTYPLPGYAYIHIRIHPLPGTVPAPLLFGTVIDTTCLLWSKECNAQHGACLYYDTTYIAWLVSPLHGQ